MTIWLTRFFYIAIAAMLWMRFAPSSVEKWHDTPINMSAPKRLGYLTQVRLTGSAAATLQALDDIALASPRTKVLAGRIAEGKKTYISRSLFLGAPDYTTVQITAAGGAGQLTIYGRLRFGIYDFGANRNRIISWLQALEALQ